MLGRGLAACAFALAAVGMQSSAATAHSSPPGFDMTVSPSHGGAGTTITAKGSGCEQGGKPYEAATAYLFDKRGSNYGIWHGDTVKVRDDGTFTATVTVPPEASPGAHVVSANCYAADMVFRVGDRPFTVDGAPRPSPTPTGTARPTPTRSPSPKPSVTPTRTTPSQRPTPTPTPRATTSPTVRPTPTPSPTRARQVETLPPPAERDSRAVPIAAAAVLVLGNAFAAGGAARRRSGMSA